MHTQFRSLRSSLKRGLPLALAAGLIPTGTAFAQGAPSVRITRESVEVPATRNPTGAPLMIASRGTVLEVVHTQGDRYTHRDDNIYWVLVPPDTWGTQRVGWISGRDVDLLPPVERAKAAPVEDPRLAELARALQQAREEIERLKAAGTAAPAASPVTATNVPAKPDFSEVILNFEFGKSDLTPDALAKLGEAAAMLKANAQAISFSLEGHADWVGSEGYNEKLGQARAEAVKRFLSEQHQIPVEKMSVVSYGESRPAAPNGTTEGRAQNRRVVIKVLT